MLFVEKNKIKVINLRSKSKREINFEFDRLNYGQMQFFYFCESKFICVYQHLAKKIDYLDPYSDKPFLIPTFSLDLGQN